LGIRRIAAFSKHNPREYLKQSNPLFIAQTARRIGSLGKINVGCVDII